MGFKDIQIKKKKLEIIETFRNILSHNEDDLFTIDDLLKDLQNYVTYQKDNKCMFGRF